MNTPQQRRPYFLLSEAAALNASLSKTPAPPPLHVDDLVERQRDLGLLLRDLIVFTMMVALVFLCSVMTMLAEDLIVVVFGYIAMLIAGAITIGVGEIVADELPSHAPAIRRGWGRFRRRLRSLAGGTTALS